MGLLLLFRSRAYLRGLDLLPSAWPTLDVPDPSTLTVLSIAGGTAIEVGSGDTGAAAPTGATVEGVAGEMGVPSPENISLEPSASPRVRGTKGD